MEDDADLREQLFHNTVRENIVSTNSLTITPLFIDHQPIARVLETPCDVPAIATFPRD